MEEFSKEDLEALQRVLDRINSEMEKRIEEFRKIMEEKE